METGTNGQILIEVSLAEHATILAALRYYQRFALTDPVNLPLEIAYIASNLGSVQPLDDDDIDHLCERLNE